MSCPGVLPGLNVLYSQIFLIGFVLLLWYTLAVQYCASPTREASFVGGTANLGCAFLFES
jgi:hypothetical protein